jgi:hypothetical protein
MSLGIEEVKTAYRSPWQNPYVERLIGTIRRECLDLVWGIGVYGLGFALEWSFIAFGKWGGDVAGLAGHD